MSTNPDAVEAIHSYCKENLSSLSVVDNHEKPENIRYRHAFIQRYFQYELRCHRWWQISKAEYEAMIRDGKLAADIGYHYTQNGEQFVELHVDDHTEFQEKAKSCLYGGKLSVRFDSKTQKPLMILGQDEAIFKQFIFSNGVWITPDGQKQLIPKDDGQGVMLSSFVSRELGYGYTLPEEVKDRVNKMRHVKEYSDTEAAEKETGSKFKKDILTSPFVKEFEYGSNFDGYWTYDQMILQLEDCIDVLKVAFPGFQYLLIFDHSNGHDRMRPNGLNINKINLRFGGRQPVMRESKLTKNEFGPFHDHTYTLQPGMDQSMQFTPSHEGPCYLSVQEQIERRLDQYCGETKQKTLTKSQLVEKLKEAGLPKPIGNKKELQKLCEDRNIPISFSEDTVIEGWVNKPKGAVQILYERGWIDPAHLHHYTKEGKNEIMRQDQGNPDSEPVDPTGCSFSIKKLMQLQNEFLDEVTLLQYHGNLLGCLVDRSPKCHPEIAGEGIE